MNSETPRTNAKAMLDCDSRIAMVTADFARQLERELAEANTRTEKWQSISRELARALRNHPNGRYPGGEEVLIRFNELNQ